MRRRWKALVAVGAVALLAGLLFLLPPREDGLDWVRKFGGREDRPVITTYSDSRKKEVNFHFERIPDGLLDRFKKMRNQSPANRGVPGFDRWGYSFSVKHGLVVAWIHEPLNWAEKTMRDLRKRIGI